MSAALLLLVLAAPPEKVVVGSKSFTESVIVGEMVSMLSRQADLEARHRRELGGTQILWSALKSGEIDVYPEYTGTIREEMFEQDILPDDEAIRARLAQEGVLMSQPLGFNNTYAIGVKEELAARLNLTNLSDLADHPDLIFTFSSEFMQRGDGWPSLRRRYKLPQANVRGLEHALAYQAVDAGDAHATDVYSTDPAIKQFGLRVLVDDLGHFPRYDAVLLYRADLRERAPAVVDVIGQLEGRLSDGQMLELNQRVELNHQSEAEVAAGFLNQELGLEIEVKTTSLAGRIARTTVAHLFLVAVSLCLAIMVALPLGVISAKKPSLGQVIVGAVEVIQTIPGLALLVLMAAAFSLFSLPTIGPLPAIVALFLYSLLPIVRNTLTGLTGIPKSLEESAIALGLTSRARLFLIELPLASRLILAGVKTTAVMNVGYAALGGLIGAGGYGQTIMSGLRLNSVPLMLEGAVPAACLALLVKALFEFSEKWLVPKGLQVASSS